MFVKVDVYYGISQGTNPPFHPAQGLELELPRHATAKCAGVSKGHSDTPTLRHSELGSSRAQTPPGAPPSRSSALRTPSFLRASARSRFDATRRIVDLALVCFFASGVAWPAQAQLSDPALSDVIANPATIKLGESSALQWTPREDVEAVLIRTGGGLAETQETGTSHVVRPTETTTYTLVAMGEGAELGTFELTVTVTSAPSGPALSDVIANPATIKLGESSALQWTPREDVEAVLIRTGGGLAETQETGTSHVVRPTETTTYTLVAMGEGAELGTFELTVTVTSAPSGPALSDVIANPATIKLGESSALQWTPREDVEAVLIRTGGGLAETQETGTSHVVRPTETTTYTLVAMGEGAELGTFELTVTVNPTWADDPALSDVIANPATIKLGESSALQWTPREDVEAVLIRTGGGLAETQETGTSHVVRPTETTTYTLVAMGEGAELGTFELTVTVTSAPSGPALSDVIANPATIKLGESSALQWTPREDVEAVLIRTGGGLAETQETGTSHVVRPTETTTYTLVAMGEGAELGTFELTVTVTSAPSGPALSDVIANPATIKLGESSALQWTPREDVEAVLIRTGGGLAETQETGTSHVVRPTETTTYTLVAMGEGAELGTFELTVTVNPTWADDPALSDVIANPATIKLGESSALQWTPREDVEAVLIRTGGGLAETQETGTSHVVRPTETTTYTLVAMGEGAELGTFELTVTVTSAPSGPALSDVIANPATIKLGESSALQWTPREDVEAVLIRTGGGLAETQETGTSHVVRPTETTTYTLVAMGEGAELGTFELTVTVNPTWADDPALSDVIANPATIKLGESSALQWTPREDVEAVLIRTGGGLAETQETGTSHVVRPTETTTYTLVAMGEGAELGTFELTVTVNPTWADDPALSDVIANPATIKLGESSALQWTPREDVEAVLIRTGGGLAETQETGTSHVVRPTETTTYTLVAMGEGAELGTFELTVTVNPTWADDPALSDVIANPATIKLGESSALQWTPREDVEAVLIRTGGGLAETQETGTSHVVRPTETTTYTLVAMGEGAELGTFELTVTVNPTWADDPALSDVIANPATIKLGESSALQWTPREDVEAVLIRTGGGLAETQETGTSHVVRPTETTTYTLVAMGEGAELGTFELTVTVNPTWADDPALSDVIANPATIKLGESSALQWTPREDVEAVLIRTGGGLAETQETGTSHVVRPTETTTYTLVAMGEGAELGTFELTVTVNPTWADDPALSDVIANPATIKLGESSALQWTPREDVEAVLIRTGGGLAETQETGTSHVVRPTETTTYTLVAMGEGAELGTFELTVTVNPTWADDPALSDVIANPATIKLGESSALQWTPREDVEAVLIRTGGGLAETQETGTSHVVRPTETTTYTLVAMGEGAELGTFELTVHHAPSGPALSDVIANPATIKLGESSALQWTPREDVEAVLIRTGGGLAETQETGTSHVVRPTETTTYTLVAMGEGAELGTFELTVTVTSAPSGPALSDVIANPATIKLGESSALQWTPREDVEAVLIRTGGGLAETQETGTSHVVRPTETTTYTLVAMGEGAELGTFELTVTVNPTWADDPALSDVIANPATIKLGESSALQWTPREDVEAVLIRTGGGLAETQETGTSHVVRPTETTTYTLVAMGEGAELGTFELTVTVTSAPSGPALSDVIANPATIKLGESSALQWTPREDVEAVLIRTGGGLAETQETGTSHVVRPTETTTYTLVAMGEGAELGTFELTVTVNPTWADDPALSDVIANPATIKLGESSALQWTPREDVEAVLIRTGGGLAETQETGTSHVVRPTETTTYTLVAMGEGAELGTFELTVTVNPTWADDPALSDVIANPATIKLGESSALQWTPREDVEAVLIRTGGGLAETQETGTSHVVRPTETTTYTLVAMGEGAELGTFELTVTVNPTWADDPALSDVIANPATIKLGESSALQWTPREDVEAVLIRTGGGLAETQETGTSHVVRPTETTTYTLVAMGEGAELGTFELTVTVNPTWADDPALSDVIANPATIKLGESSALQWTPREDVEAVLIRTGGGLAETQETGTSHVVRPTETTTYTLVAMGEGAELGTFELTVTVNPTWADDPALSDVIANPATIKLGESSALQWTPREDVVKVVVTLPDGTTADVEPLEGRYEVTPDAVGKFTYALEAYDEEGALLVTGGPFKATVTVTPVRPTPPPPPVNRAPVAQDDEGPEVKFGGSVEIDAATLTANDADADGDTLTVTAVSNPQHGTASLSGGTITFEHDGESDAAEGYAFTYTVSDGNGGTDTATVSGTVVPVNRAPVAQDDEGPEVKFGGSVEIDAATLTANDADADGDTLTVTGSATAARHGEPERRHDHLRARRRVGRGGRLRLHLHGERRQRRHRHGDRVRHGGTRQPGAGCAGRRGTGSEVRRQRRD